MEDEGQLQSGAEVLWPCACACRARKELASIFSRIIQARRGSDSKEDDMLQSFIDSRYEKVPFHYKPPASTSRSSKGVNFHAFGVLVLFLFIIGCDVFTPQGLILEGSSAQGV